MSASDWSSKPSIDERMPRAAMIAPPGTPGAATIVMPSMRMKPDIIWKSYGMFCIIISANAHDTIFIVLPERWMVAQSGMTKPAMSLLTPLLMVWRSVTGMVAADDCVPRAVK